MSLSHTHDPLDEPIDLGQQSALARFGRYAIAAGFLVAAVLSASLILVEAGSAVVITRFGEPVRVIAEPGLAWKLPPPIESAIPIDLKLKTTTSGMHDVGTRDGLRILVQAYVAWEVPRDQDHILKFVRAVKNDPDEAARQLRSFMGSALEITASSFELQSLVNTDPKAVELDQFEARLKARLEQQVLDTYGLAVRQVGIERLTLPAATLQATVTRMRAERETVAAQRMAEGKRAAAEIRSNAERDARIIEANAKADAAAIEAKARVAAAEIFAKAYNSDPKLYTLLRSLDMLGETVNDNTRLILRTDAAPFRLFTDGPAGAVLEAPK